MLRAVAFALSLFALPVSAETVEIETFSGPRNIERNPDTVVVLDIAALDTLDVLGVEVDGVVNNLYVPYLDAGGATVVGTLFEPDYEAIAALAPDLIIAGGRSQSAVADLGKLAPTIDMTIWGDTIGQGLARLAAYGQIFDKKDAAAALTEELENKLQQARNAVSGRGSALIVMTNGTKISAYGGAGRFGWMHHALSLAEAVPDMAQASHGEAISFEFIRDVNPGILIVIDRMAAIGQDGNGAKATLDNALVRETTAWQEDRIVYLDSASTYVANGGVQSLNIFLDQIIQAFTAK